MAESEKYDQLCTEMDRLTAESHGPLVSLNTACIIQRQGIATAMAIIYPENSRYVYIRQSERRVRNGKSYFMGDN